MCASSFDHFNSILNTLGELTNSSSSKKIYQSTTLGPCKVHQQAPAFLELVVELYTQAKLNCVSKKNLTLHMFSMTTQ